MRAPAAAVVQRSQLTPGRASKHIHVASAASERPASQMCAVLIKRSMQRNYSSYSISSSTLLRKVRERSPGRVVNFLVAPVADEEEAEDARRIRLAKLHRRLAQEVTRLEGQLVAVSLETSEAMMHQEAGTLKRSRIGPDGDRDEAVA